MIISDMKTILHQLRDVLIYSIKFQITLHCTRQFNESEGHVAAARKRSHQWCLTLSSNNTETIERTTSLFSATNQERPYEQLLYTQLESEVSLNLSSLVLNSSQQLNKSTKDSFIPEKKVSEFEFKTIDTVAHRLSSDRNL